MSTLVLCPSRGRPERAAEALASFDETRKDPGSRLVFVVDRDDPTHGRYPGTVQLVDPTGCMGGAIRAVTHDRAVLGDATSVGMIGDDCRFRTPGWDLALDGWLTANIGIAWPADGWDHPWAPESKAAHWWLSRPIVDALGLAPPTKHLFMDDYWAQLGWAAGCARYFPDVLVEHLHPLAGKAAMDATYERSHRWVRDDRTWWDRWQRRGWKAKDVRRLRAVMGQAAPLRVFADWHHPALWEALSIVFEDRFGWELYSPGGSEWKRHGWALQGATPGWTADDYLSLDGAVEGPRHWSRVEPEYPRPRKQVTWDQFAMQTWDIIVASVYPHQRPFHRLARERGARFVHHIGDAKRSVDGAVRQTIIASATVRGAAVVHHQEFDREMFAPVPAQDTRTVTSLMLRLDSTSGPYGWIAEHLGSRWSAVQCEAMRGPGYLAPMAKVAERMRRSAWVWHDKRIGDGYGHVLFTAAHMGRPLIGHASHYRGLLGERLWEDGVTCIDLDRHEPGDALRMLHEVAADRDRYDSMSAAIRQRFDELVDFDAEAEAIRGALAH